MRTLSFMSAERGMDAGDGGRRMLSKRLGRCELMRGMSLVEVLVAMVILAIGLMGIASVFLRSLGNSRSALLRTQAISLVSDMSDRIRANAAGRDAYDIGRYSGTPGEHGCAPEPSASGSNCSVAELAEHDLASWRIAVERALPPASADTQAASVEFFGGEPQRYRVSVAWQEPGEALPFTYRSELLVQGVP